MPRQIAPQDLEKPEYTGSSNLEVMREARRYNDFLTRLIVGAGADAIRGRVLDFGAGVGVFADRVAPHAGNGLTCVELDPLQREELRRHGHACVADIGEIESGSQDYVYTLNVLEHIPDDSMAASELFRILRPGGRLLVYVPAFPCLFSAMDHRVGHLRRYVRRDLATLLTGAGFAIERLRYADCLGFAATLAYRLKRESDGQINRGALIAYDRLIFPVSAALDTLLHPLLGKNVYAIAVKPGP